VRWAAQSHLAAARWGAASGAAGLRLRIGVHLGLVLAHGGRVFGRTVNIACRLQQAAKPGETLVSAEVGAMLADHGQAGVTGIGPMALKHVTAPVEVFRVDPPVPARAAGPVAAALC
jgi:class 3 adenylate cyclase